MTSPFAIPELVLLFGETILRLADSQKEPARLTDLQALASVDRLARAIFGAHPDLLAARAVHKECICESHMNTPFSENLTCSEQTDRCDCMVPLSWGDGGCDCACHNPCEYCHGADLRLARTTTKDNDGIKDYQCAEFQMYSRALYIQGNRRVAQYHLAQAKVFGTFHAIVDFERVIRQTHLDLAKELFRGGFILQPYFYSDTIHVVTLLLLYPIDRFAEALDFVMSVCTTLPQHRQRQGIEHVEISILKHASLAQMSAEKLDIYASRFPGLFATGRSNNSLCQELVRHVGMYADHFPGLPLWRLQGLFKWAFESHRKQCAAVAEDDPMSCDWFLSVFNWALAKIEAVARSENLQRNALSFAMIIIRCLDPLAADKSEWSRCFSSARFDRVNKMLMCPPDCGYGSALQLQQARKRLKTAVKTDRRFTEKEAEEQAQCLAYQRVLADYMEFVGAHIALG